MTSATSDPQDLGARLESSDLAVRREALRGLDARGRLRAILAARDPAVLVRSLEAQDFFFTLHEIGVGDAGDLISLAAPEQIEFCLDLECWTGGSLDTTRLDQWLVRLGELGADELYRAIEHLDLEVLISYLHGRMTVFKRDEDTDAVEMSDPSFRTLDDLYYFSFPGASPEDDRRLSSTIGLIRQRSLQRYLDVLESVMAGLPAQAEDDALRLRDGRMLDHGFPDYDSAMGLYAFIDPRSFDPERHAKAISAAPLDDEQTATSVELEPLRIAGESFLSDVLSTVSPESAAALREELAYLIHRAVVTEVEDVTQPAALRRAAQDVSRYVSLGLEQHSARDLGIARELAEGVRLEAILRLGYGLTMVLAHRRDRLVSHPRFQALGEVGGEILGPPFRETLAALTGKRPAHALALDEPERDGHRPFRSLEDLGRVGAVLTQAEALTLLLFEHLLPKDSTPPSDASGDPLTVGRMLTTLLAHTIVGRPAVLEPFPAERLDELHERAFGPDPGPGSTVRPGALASFETWLTGVLAEFPGAWVQPVRTFVEACIDEFTEEMGPIDPSEGIDPRFLTVLWLTGDSSAPEMD